MTDGHWRRGEEEEEGIRAGVGGHWHRFKAPTSADTGRQAKVVGVRRDEMWIQDHPTTAAGEDQNRPLRLAR